MNLRHLTMAAALLAVMAGSAAWGAGIFPGFPTVDVDEDLTGNELIPADTQLPSGRNPQTELLSPADIARFARLMADSGSGNLLIGGDFGTNPWARGASFVQNGVTASYTADRWWVTATASAQTTRQTSSASLVSGSAASLRFQRQDTATNVENMCIGQVLESEDSLLTQGRKVTFSFYARAGAAMSTVSSRVSVLIRTGTASNQTSVLFSGGNWTGSANLVSQTQDLTSTWTRYQFTGSTASDTSQIGVRICAAFGERDGTAEATDFFEMANAQLEVGQRASYFQYRPPVVELVRAQRYTQAIAEPTSGVYLGFGAPSAVGTGCYVSVPLTVALRRAPSMLIDVGTFLALASNQAYAAVTAITSGLGTGSAIRAQVSVAANVGNISSCGLVGQGGTGRILLNAEL